MFKKVNKKASRIVAYLLAIMVMVGFYPSEIIMTALAEGTEPQGVDYTIIVKCGDTPLNDVSLEFVNISDETDKVTGYIDDETGKAIVGLTNGNTYKVTATKVGYEQDPTEYVVVNGTPDILTVTMTALQEATITGTVTDGTAAYEGATVTLSGYGADVTDTTDENGEYTLTGYVGKAYTVTVTPKSGDGAMYSVAGRTSEIASATATQIVDFALVKNKCEITVSTNNTKGSVVIKDNATKTEIADLSNVDYGTEVIVEVTTEDGYRVAEEDGFAVTGYTGAALDNEGKYTFTVKSDVAVSVKFEQYLFAVSGNLIDSGRIVFTSGVDVNNKAEKDSDILYTVKAPDNHCIDKLTIKNGAGETETITSAKNLETFNGTLNGVAGEVVFNATFKPITYTVSFAVGADGKVTYNDGEDRTLVGAITGTSSADHGESFSFKATATAQGYHVEKIEIKRGGELDRTISLLDGTNANTEVEKIIEGITKNITVNVEFAINTYNVSVTNNSGGTAYLDIADEDKTTTNVNHNGSVKLLIKPNVGYGISKITSNGQEISGFTLTADEETYEYTFNNIVADTGIVVEFVVLSPVDFGNNVTFNSNEAVAIHNKDNCVEYIFANDGEAKFNTDKMGIKINGVKGERWRKNSWTTSESYEITRIELYSSEWHLDYFGADGWRDVTLEKHIKIIIDKTAPEITLETPASITTNSEVNVKFSVNDDYSPIEKVIYSTANNYANITADNSWDAVAGANGKYSFTLTEEQNKTYYIYAIDKAGNVSVPTTVSVLIDTTAPTVASVTKNPGADYTNGSVKISATASDTNTTDANLVSGVNRVVYTTEKLEDSNGNVDADRVKALPAESNLSFGNGEYSLTVNGEQAQDYYIYAIDDAGNVSQPETITVKIDETPPTIETIGATAADWTKDNEVTISATASDSSTVASGVNRVVYTTEKLEDSNGNVDAAAVKALTTTAVFDSQNNEYTFTVTGEQNNTYYVYAIDTAGNVSTAKTIDVKIDSTEPVVDGFEFEPVNTNPTSKAINFLTFGMFFNEKIKVTAFVRDDVGVYQSGCDRVVFELCEDGKPPVEKTSTVVDGKAFIEISASFEGVVKATVYDKAGNNSDETLATSANSNAKSSGIMIETINPTIEIGYPAEPANQNEKTATAGEWYNEDVAFSLSIKDAESGIRSVVISINGKPLVNKIYKDEAGDVEEHEETFNVSTSQVEANADADGSYKLEVTVIDNACNVEKATRTIYKDTAAPYITKFSFDGTGYKESSEEKAVAQITDYGFYFTTDTKVTVYAEDKAPSAGIKEIICYTQAVNQTEEVKVTDVTANADGTYSFTIKAGFKGQIFAEVNDNVGNGSGICSPDKAVVESQEQHNAATEAHVALSIPETTVKTASGSPLYKATVPVSIVVTDTFAGIRKIEWSVTSAYDTTNNQTGSIELANVINTAKGGVYEGWKVDEKENNLVTVMSKTIDVANNSNDIVVKVTMTDRAGNTTTKEITFSIDKVAPMIDVTYDNNTPDADYDSFYKANRVATIVVTERNFNKDDVKIVIENTDAVIPALSEWVAVENKEDPDKTTYTATITYAADGDYTFDIDYNDRATNAAVYVVGEGVNNAPLTAEDFEKHEFTIDKTLPVVKVAYDNNKALNDNYYAAERTATITVTEHNFDKDRIVITGNATDNGKAVAFPAITGWTAKGDVYTTTINYKADAEYTFDIKLTDKAGNIDDTYKEESFFVDKTVPELKITNVSNDAAYAGSVTPVVSYSDTNFDAETVKITLRGANRGEVKTNGTKADAKNGAVFTFADFEKIKSVDDIYTLTATLTDKAGNTSTETVRFSVNRFGSTYELSKSLKKYNGAYVQSVEDVVITEINANRLENIKLTLFKNSETIVLKENTDYKVTVNGGGGSWYSYTYTVFKSVFSDDGVYRLSIHSEDAAGNVAENTLDTKDKEISFGIDTTLPNIVVANLEKGETYPEAQKEVKLSVNDNMLIETLTVYFDDNETPFASWTAKEIADIVAENGEFKFVIPGDNGEEHKVRIVCVDAAGNVQEQLIDEFYVTTNKFVQFYNNKALFFGSIGGGVSVTALAVFFIVKKRKL